MFFYILYRNTMDKYEVGKFKVSKGICVFVTINRLQIYIYSFIRIVGMQYSKDISAKKVTLLCKNHNIENIRDVHVYLFYVL